MQEEENLLIDTVIDSMLKKVEKPADMFLFCYIFLLGHTGVEASKVLDVHPSDVARRLRRIRSVLRPFKLGYGESEKDLSVDYETFSVQSVNYTIKNR